MLSYIEKFFQLRANHTSIKTETLAGIATFLTMSYIIFVNPGMLAQTGMDAGAVFVATCLAAAFGSMRLWECLQTIQLHSHLEWLLMPILLMVWYLVLAAAGKQHLGAVFISGLIFLTSAFFQYGNTLSTAFPNHLNWLLSQA